MKGFRMLTVCWSDGASCFPIDFALLSSSDSKNQLSGNHKAMDKRSCAWQRRKEAVTKSTEQVKIMVQRVLGKGFSAKYLLMDSWFMMPARIMALIDHIKVIGMIKKSPKIHYRYNGKKTDLKSIYEMIKKRRGRAKILASVIADLSENHKAKIVFVRDRRKKDWLAILSTDIELSNEDIVRIYGKRWDIEAFFKMAKQHLKLAKKIQCRDYDALIAHTSIVFMRYMFLSYQLRLRKDNRTFGELFYACCDEIKDISFVEALHRVLILTVDKIRQTGNFCEKLLTLFLIQSLKRL